MPEEINGVIVWSAQDLADAAGLTVQRIRQLCDDGTIPAKRLGREWLIGQTIALLFLKARREQG